MNTEDHNRWMLRKDKESNEHQQMVESDHPLRIPIIQITCNICDESFVIYKPESLLYESGNNEHLLTPLSFTPWCPFCGG